MDCERCNRHDPPQASDRVAEAGASIFSNASAAQLTEHPNETCRMKPEVWNPGFVGVDGYRLASALQELARPFRGLRPKLFPDSRSEVAEYLRV